MARTFFTSDIHLGHRGVLDFDNRPWDNLDDMNEGLITRWNNKVGKGDHVYILGDLCWLSGEKARLLVSRLNGNLHLIRGNHDRISKASYRELFASIKDYDTVHVHLSDGTNRRVVMSHYPIPLYHGHYNDSIHLYGHVHNTSEEALTRQIIELLHKQGITCEMYNVWCGFYDWAPATLDEIIEANQSSRKTNY